MKALTILLCLVGVWLLYSALKLDANSHHRGSKLHLLERVSRREVSEAWRSDLQLAITEGKHGFVLLEDAVSALASAGLILVLLSGAQMLLLRKKPNKAPEPTPTAVTSPAAQEPRQP